MKQTFYQIAIALLAILLSSANAMAQKKDSILMDLDKVRIIIDSDGDTITTRKGTILTISNLGIKIGDGIKNQGKKKKKHKKLHVGMHFDFGINNIVDQTDYAGLQSSQGLVATDSTLRNLNKNDLALRNGKSINFNLWPIWLKQDIAKHNVQIETGLGFQFFNYRYETTVKHSDDIYDAFSTPNRTGPFTRSGFQDVSDPNQLTGKEKNKLGVSYVSIPLMIRFNSDKKKDHRYFIGAGVIGSYKLKSWTKFYGNKESGNYGINDWMTQVTAELGVTGVIKLYGTYALQSMYSNGLERQPFAIGIRL